MSLEILSNDCDTLSVTRHQQFCADMADGLHALAQPLSVLRSAVELLANAGTVPAVNRQRYLDLSVEHMQRTCDLFGSLQDLLVTEIQEPRLAAVDLRALVAPLVEARTATLQPLGIGVAATVPEELSRIFGDAVRIERAVVAAFDIAISVAERCDLLEVTLSSSGSFVEFAIHNTRCHGRKLNAAARLNLSLARSSVLSLEGRCAFSEDTFSVAFAFPVSDDGQRHC